MSDVSVERSRLSLLKLLTLPFLAVILLLGATVGALSYRTSTGLAEDAARRWLGASVQRIGEALERRRLDADRVLQAAFPDGGAEAAESGADLDSVAQRMWTALSLHAEVPGELRLATASGLMLGLRRLSASEAEFTLQRAVAAPVEGRLFRAPPGVPPPSLTATLEVRPDSLGGSGDVRALAWYRAGLSAGAPAWLPPATSPLVPGLSQWRARRVLDSAGRVAGVAAVDVSFKALDDILRDLDLPPQALALVVDSDGQLVALRGAAVTRNGDSGVPRRLSVAEAAGPVAATLIPRLLPLAAGGSPARPAFNRVELPDGQLMLASVARVGDASSPPWAVIAAAPRGDFAAEPWALLARSAAAALIAAAVVLLAGAWVRRRIARDALELAQLAQRVGDGDLETPCGPLATQELEILHDNLRRMQLRLRTDRISGLANRESVLSRLHDRMRPGRRHNDAPLLALLFVDLDRFRAVNERHGHDAGDFVLQTIGRRLRQTVRDTDLVARWSGDEFVLLLDGVGTAEQAQRVRDQVERVLRDPVELGPGRDAVELDGTVGLALSPADAQEPDALMRAAENDMLQRKPSSQSSW